MSPGDQGGLASWVSQCNSSSSAVFFLSSAREMRQAVCLNLVPHTLSLAYGIDLVTSGLFGRPVHNGIAGHSQWWKNIFDVDQSKT